MSGRPPRVNRPLGGRSERTPWRCTARPALRNKLVLSVALILVAVSLAGLGAYATFTSSASVSQSVTTGTVTIALGATGTANNRLDVATTGVVPGDTIQRAVNVSNTGNQ